MKKFGLLAVLLTSCGARVHQSEDITGACVLSQGCIKLAWDAVTQDASGNPVTVDGYELYWGSSTGVYTHSKDVGNHTTGQIDGLTPGLQYFVVTAYLGQGTGRLESPYSNEVSATASQPRRKKFLASAEIAVQVPRY